MFPKMYINFNKPDEKETLIKLTVADAKKYMEEKHILPKAAWAPKNEGSRPVCGT